MTSNNKKNKKGNIKNYHKNCSRYLLVKTGSYGLWSNTLIISWGASLKTWSVSLQYLWSFFTLPHLLTLKPEKTRKSRQAKKGVWWMFLVAKFWGTVNHHNMDEGQASTNGYFNRNITLKKQLKHNLLILSTLPFFLYTTLSPTSSPFLHLLAVISLSKKAKKWNS